MRFVCAALLVALSLSGCALRTPSGHVSVPLLTSAASEMVTDDSASDKSRPPGAFLVESVKVDYEIPLGCREAAEVRLLGNDGLTYIQIHLWPGSRDTKKVFSPPIPLGNGFAIHGEGCSADVRVVKIQMDLKREEKR